VPKNQYGTFYSGDSYVLLATEKFRNNTFRWNIHFWLGKESSQDERGAAAIISMQLDEYLGGYPVQYREIQTHESNMFMSYFPTGITYRDGGVDSAFNSITSNMKKRTRILQVKGRRQVRATEVIFSWASLNKGDCFIIELDNTIYLWKGSESNPFEVLKARQMATQIRDTENGGRGEIKQIEERGYVPIILKEWLGEPPKTFSPATPDDEPKLDFLKKQSSIDLHHVCCDTGNLVIQKVESYPNLQKSMLLSGDSYILDAGNEGSIFVWKGKKASKDERSEAILNAEKFLKQKDYPEYTKIVVLSENCESVMFKSYFKSWN